MGSVDQIDDRTFRADFTGDGAERLRDRVKEKLKEFMGDYTDDTLVEYVIVLLKNGRRKEEARNELNVFLGDDTDSFVSWLWDHLAVNIGSYVKSDISLADDSAVNPESDKGKPSRESRTRRKREWAGMGKDSSDPPPLRSSEIENVDLDERSHQKSRRTRRSRSPGLRKRSRADEQQTSKREMVELQNGATRRLLQFAVRDAVGTSRPSNATSDPSLKRLRSVVSNLNGSSSLVDHPRRIKSVATVVNPMASVIKAVAEAAEDAVKAKSSMSVFDRLGRDMAVSHVEANVEDCEDGEDNQLNNQRRSVYLQRNSVSDPSFENGRYEDVNALYRNVSQAGTSGEIKDEDSMNVDYSVAHNTKNVMRLKRNIDLDRPVVASNLSQKNVLTSVTSNTWKPSNTSNLIGSGIRKPAVDSQKELNMIVPPPSSGQTVAHLLEDADSRTLFVSNVHFGATKDSLSRHFNKFGEVLKVLIVTDATTGQPTGSAYVEFMRKEAADNALSLDGTSFMSRLLKVVKRTAAQPEAAATVTWPRARGVPFNAATRFPRASFPRGITGQFRGRPNGKPGPRSFQWKREAQPSPAESSLNAPLSTNARSLTYVRTLPKPEAEAGTA